MRRDCQGCRPNMTADSSRSLRRRLVAEGVGTATLLAAVVGSGIMGDRLSGGNVAIALLANSLATGAALVALILTFGPISGAHFNPAVSFADASQSGLSWRDASMYAIATRKVRCIPSRSRSYAATIFPSSTCGARVGTSSRGRMLHR